MVAIIDDTCLHYPLGTRIKIGENYGTVKYVGEVLGHAGSWLGIEWDDPKRGKHNGSVEGKLYFQTHHPTAGSFIRPGKVGPCQSLEESARERYLGDYSLDQDLIKDAQKSLHAAFFEVVGMDQVARKQSKFEQLTDVSVDGCDINSAGYLKDFHMLTTLNLSQTLVWNWETIAEITKQIPTLTNLNLSSNRFVVPTDAQVKELEMSFRNLKHLNLRNCNLNDWKQVMQTAKLWPHIQSLGLQENALAELSPVNCNEIFKNLRELDLHRTKIMDFDQVCKLGNIKTLTSLNLMENGIEQIKFPDCDPSDKLNLFQSLEQLNILYNPIWNESDAFNELDKLPKLKSLNKTPALKSSFDEMFSNAVALVCNLEMLNKALINREERRGAEYDIWKKYAADWVLAQKSPETAKEFYKKHRSYANIVKKYGSPADFVPRANLKQSKLLKLRIKNGLNGELWEKKVPRNITVQTLQGLVVKRFQLDQGTMPLLCVIDEANPLMVVPLDHSSKTLDFFSVQENDCILVKW